MKKRIVLAALSLCVLMIFAGLFMPAAAQEEAPAATVTDKALAARFTNMLNRNYCYNADYESTQVMTDNAVIALLDKRDTENPDYISEALLKSFVNDMYGIGVTEITDDAAVHKDGFVYITPRGFTSYSHTITGVTENEDGSFSVASTVTVNPHDDDEFITTADTLFIPNTSSVFGYSIIYSNLSGVVSGI